MSKSRILLDGLIFLVLAACGSGESKPSSSNPDAGDSDSSEDANYQLLRYSLDRSALPNLYYHDLTLIIDVGTITSAIVLADGVAIPHRYEADLQKLIVTTEASALEVYVANATNPAGFGDFEVAPLYDDKRWAWSQGFDDNSLYTESVDAYKELGYQATVFMIGELIDDSRTEYWIVDASSGTDPSNNNYVTGLKELSELEWGIGNHGWGPASSCNDSADLEWEVLRENQRLLEIIAQSNNPTYKPIAVAAPCFLGQYQGIVADLRDHGTDRTGFTSTPIYLQFNESGNLEVPYITDSETDYSQGSVTAKAFSFDTAVSRDYRIEDSVSLITDMFDWMSANADSEHHFWYNTLSHGGHNDKVIAVLNYADSHYGSAGSDEAWIAPSDRIYSYLMHRDQAIVSFDGLSNASPPKQ
ncbi:MAG: hypothetical protein IPJ88_18580 [Myxococcales bacterium]|nr:MAG: hypothetical protein IPJ88_18580 [Myxococcales bacterium]